MLAISHSAAGLTEAPTYLRPNHLPALLEGTLPYPPPALGRSTDVAIWHAQHQADARTAHQQFRPTASRLEPGLVVSLITPGLSAPVADLWWSDSERGACLYKAPFSQMLYPGPIAAHEVEICYLFALLTNWRDPNFIIDYVVWTPSGSSIISYTPDRELGSGLTLRGLWTTLLGPAITEYYRNRPTPPQPTGPNYYQLATLPTSRAELLAAAAAAL